MSLDAYRSKRRFDKTREPAPEAKPVATGDAIFVVQLHHASRRHYDFRLQVGDTLKSWAVPKGPSLDPKVKRLAAEVEDHPLAYATFEGDIPKGEYGAGHVAIFDSGTWSTEGDAQAQLDAGHLKFQLQGRRLNGGWHLVRSRRVARQPEWLLFKQRDEHAAESVEADDLLDEPDPTAPAKAPPVSKAGTAEPAALNAIASKSAEAKATRKPAASKAAAAKADASKAPPSKAAALKASSSKAASSKSPSAKAASSEAAWRGIAAALPGSRIAALRPDAITPQLARLVDDPPEGDEWLHEPKWDGYRILALIERGEVSLWSRNRLQWTRKIPAIATALSSLGLRAAALDGELIAGHGSQKDFGLLQATLSGERRGALSYMLFDILHLDGVDLTGVPLSQRKDLLEQVLKKAPHPLIYSSHIVGHGKEVFKEATAQGLEGIISKRADAPHQDGRSDDWRKIKEAASDEFAVVGFTPPKGARTGFGALLLARPDAEHGWRYTGRLGTGFSRDQLTELLQQIDRETQATPTVFVPPHDTDLRGARWIEPSVVVEAFYRGVGKEGLLRQPSLKTVRTDKRIEDLRDSDRGTPSSGAGHESKPTERAAEQTEQAAEPARLAMATRRAARPTGQAAESTDEKAEEVPRLTHPERVVFGDRGTTKGDIAAYYVSVMPWLLPEIINRPLSIIRCTQGIEKACFFQKHATAGLSLVDTVPIREESGKDADYLVVRNAESLMELVQFNAIEFHPWGSTAEQPDMADRLVFDLDPGPGVKWDQLVASARQIRDLLADLSLVSFVKSSGGKGLHVVVPLNPGCDWGIAKPFARSIAESLAAREPSRYVATASKAARDGRVFIDYLRNGRGATSVASWSLRSRIGAPVAVPLAWDDLDRLDRPDAFDIQTAPRRIEESESDPWEAFSTVSQDLDAAAKAIARITS